MSDISPESIVIQLPEEHPRLPLDIAENILCRLPVKTLKRFRAVDKSWRALIDSESFAKAHFHSSLASNSNRNIISCIFGFHAMNIEFLSTPTDMEPPFEYNNKDVDSIEHKVLPKCPVKLAPRLANACENMYGFAYDEENDDYKVVKVMWHKKRPLSEEWVYSLKLDSWRKTKAMKYQMGHWPVPFRGALHALAGNDDVKLMGFNIVTETNFELPLPKLDHDIERPHLTLELFDGTMLALACVYASEVVIWVMREYGVAESWQVIFSMPNTQGPMWPLALSKDGEKILFNYRGTHFAYFGLREHSVQDIALPYIVWPRLIVETLISPHFWDKRKAVEESSTKEQKKNGGKGSKGRKKKESKTKGSKDDHDLSAAFNSVL
ncbi:F-box and associated interaction domains-containing protein [Striga asiatica]|uniref:F-box and associated interaction domains-containing protein n=1 Tax=Striga asiatica TaxID=4170 RepID=A0A5A7NXR8_STRAF|nr:F-box and associated interaction domains-containing protein [Striga asiatica]